MKSELVPRIRFGEFEGAWVKDELANHFTVVSGQVKPVGNEYEDYVLIAPNHIESGTGTILEKVSAISQGAISGKYIFEAGDVIYSKIRPYLQKAFLATFEGLCSADMYPLRAHDTLDPSYLLYVMLGSRLDRYAQSVSYRTGIPKINREELSQFALPIPSLPEQQKIAAFLTAVDGRLAELRRQVAALERYKRGVMQVLMGPEKFKSWEVIKAGDLFRSVSNKNHNGELPILAITQDQGTVYRDDLDKDILTSAKSIQSYKIIDKGDFIISLRSFQGGIEYSDIRGICSPAYTILKPIRPIVDDFYKAYFKKDRFVERLSKTTVGIREGKQISYGAFAALKIPYPPLPEQRRIATFLRALDARIGLVERQLAGAVAFKRGLLQGMFV